MIAQHVTAAAFVLYSLYFITEHRCSSWKRMDCMSRYNLCGIITTTHYTHEYLLGAKRDGQISLVYLVVSY